MATASTRHASGRSASQASPPCSTHRLQWHSKPKSSSRERRRTLRRMLVSTYAIVSGEPLGSAAIVLIVRVAMPFSGAHVGAHE